MNPHIQVCRLMPCYWLRRAQNASGFALFAIVKIG
jgi:hypothetical protein